MAQTSKTPPVGGGASRDGLEGASHHSSNLDAYRAQFLTLAYAVSPEVAVMLAAIVFGGGQ